MIVGSSLKLYSALRSYLVRLLNLLEEISMSNNLSSRLLRYVSMTVSLFLGLNEDLGLNFSYENGFSSFLKCHIGRSSLPYSPNSVFTLLSILFAVGKLESFRQKGDFSFREISSRKINNIATNEFTF